LAAKVADHHHAGRDANANRERFRGARLESANRGNDIEPRPHGSLGIVFVREGISEIGQYPVAPELSEEAVIGSGDTGAGGVIGIDNDAHVLRIESGRQRSGAHKVADHHGEVTALSLVTRARFRPRRKLGRCGRGSSKLGNRPEQSPAISKKHDAKLLLEILVREVPKDRKIDPVLGKPVRILGESERSEPLSDRWHCATRPLVRGSLRKRAAIRDRDLQARPRMLSCRICAPRPPQMRLRSAAPTRCRCSRSSDRAAPLRAAVNARAAARRSGHPDERYELVAFHSLTSAASASTGRSAGLTRAHGLIARIVTAIAKAIPKTVANLVVCLPPDVKLTSFGLPKCEVAYTSPQMRHAD